MTISAVMIVKNEEKTLRRCLKSLRGHVDKILIADTGSTDGTIKIANSYCAEVIQIKWTGDFSEARNAALAHSRSNWNFIIDADEWVVSGGGQLKRFGSEIPSYVGQIKRLDKFPTSGGLSTASIWLSRILPAGVFYKGAIHEQPVHNFRTERTDIRLGHDGYMPERLKQKSNRNKEILLRELEHDEHNGYYLFQLGKEYEKEKDYTKAAEAYSKALTVTQSAQKFRHDLVVRSINTFKHAGLFEKVFEIAENVEFPDSPDFYYALGDAYLDIALGNPSLGKHFIPIIEGFWKRCIDLGENDKYDTTVIGRGSFFAAENLHNLYKVTGDAVNAERYKLLQLRLKKEGR